MARQFVYAASVTQLEGKKGKLKCDKDGYYEHLVGAFNVYNNVGNYYEMTEKVANLFDTSSDFTRLVSQGKMFGECDHPSFDPYSGRPDGVQAYMHRLREILTTNIACHFRKFRLQEIPGQERGQKVIGVFAELKPLNDALRISLETPSVNTCFSVRSFINKRYEGMTEIREIRELLTYDWITAGGVAHASKMMTPSLESAIKQLGLESANDGILITPDLVDKMESYDEAYFTSCKAAGMEADDLIIDVTRIRDHLGAWREVPTFDLTPRSTFLEW